MSGTRSVFAERTSGGYFVDFQWKRDELARYGLSIDDAQMVVTSAVGGDTVTTTVEGRERYSVNVRYFRDYRSDIDRLRRVIVPTMDGRMQVPVSQLADVKLVSGPAMLRDENGMLNGYVYVDVAGRDIGGYVNEAKRVVAREGEAARRVLARLERPVRSDGARARTPHSRAADHAVSRVDAALPQHAVAGEDRDHHARRPLLRRRRHLAALRARLQHEHRRLGRAHRAAWASTRKPVCSCSSISISPTTRLAAKAGCASIAISRTR